ncbi:MAG: serine/threonine protein kinase [Gammaproteobacteria bacterium]|jgi:serine/threonine protein kinase
MPNTNEIQIDCFDLQPGRLIANKYEVIEKLGAGWEGEVYKIMERDMGIDRAAKLFYPQRNPRDKIARLYAKKLHKLRHCPIIIQYHNKEVIKIRKTPITVLISEYVEGEKLSDFINRQRGKRLPPFQAIHFLHALTTGMEQIHYAGEYHGDLHTDNIIVNRYGLGFDLKVIDFYHWSASKRENIQYDIMSMIRVFYELIGGAKHYSKQPDNIKKICCGLKQSLILKKFPSTVRLREHIELMDWD